MPSRPARLVPAALGVVLILSACSSSTDPATSGVSGPSGTSALRPTTPGSGPPIQSASAPTVNTSGLPPCNLPPRIPFPAWVPRDLPLPAGTYATKDLGQDSGYFKALFVLSGNTINFAKFVLKEWPKMGYQLGRGDSEPGEVEDQFIKPPAVGAFKAQDQFCNPGFTLMLMIYTPNRSSLPLPGTSPQSPLNGASPTASPTS